MILNNKPFNTFFIQPQFKNCSCHIIFFANPSQECIRVDFSKTEAADYDITFSKVNTAL